jgi:hypothetical protein
MVYPSSFQTDGRTQSVEKIYECKQYGKVLSSSSSRKE